MVSILRDPSPRFFPQTSSTTETVFLRVPDRRTSQGNTGSTVNTGNGVDYNSWLCPENHDMLSTFRRVSVGNPRFSKCSLASLPAQQRKHSLTASWVIAAPRPDPLPVSTLKVALQTQTCSDSRTLPACRRVHSAFRLCLEKSKSTASLSIDCFQSLVRSIGSWKDEVMGMPVWDSLPCCEEIRKYTHESMCACMHICSAHTHMHTCTSTHTYAYTHRE